MNDLALPSLFGISAFSGVGMLDEGFRAGLEYLGIPYRTVCHVEREAYAASVLAARMEEGSLAKAPIWPDITTIDAGRWRRKVDCIVAGFPCQDLSVAGKRAGLDGRRSGLFFELIRIADACGAWLMLLENVAGITSATASVVDSEEGELEERAAARVLGELADGGWNAEWLTLSASDVGASHGRARWFCLAWRGLGNTGLQYQHLQQWVDGSEHPRTGDAVADTGGRKFLEPRRGQEGRGGTGSAGEEFLGDAHIQREQQSHNQDGPFARERSRDCTSWPSSLMANTESDIRRSKFEKRSPRSGRTGFAGDGSEVANTCGTGQQRDELHGSCADNRRWPEAHGSTGELCSLFAPGPNDPRWADIIRQHPERAPALESDFRCMVDGLAFSMGDSRAARLKCVGNGVVALQAAAATVILIRRAMSKEK